MKLTETVSLGTTTIGTIRLTDRGYEAFGPADQYIATFCTLPAARKALWEMHCEGEKGLAGR
ncbi:hypothetical protein [Devosia sp. 1635]|uniref:hypothetical protein n=1 Tax=Devosia sp. 1635 TaxID=2726066 RepID=UPI00156349B6|nr:hypothetical protein [Devosia sp. 1635]